TIINNAIRLSTYSKRFTIRTMQLVGATRSFIRRPFIKQSIVHGIIASMVALALLVGLIYLIEKELFLMLSSTNILLFILLGVAIIAIGILINIVSTYFAVNKYLSISDDNLYY
ncbi:MAG: cell division protein FtsX, partial [Bacteroidales bacterium]|nr:cell division protein FtsX [Bacteroidales bacterium]